MSKYLYDLLEKIVTYLNRIYDFDLRIVNYNGNIFIRDVWCYDDEKDEDGMLLKPKEFGRDYSGSCALDTFLTKAEQSIAKTNFNIT